jgi:hypothetical protein
MPTHGLNVLEHHSVPLESINACSPAALAFLSLGSSPLQGVPCFGLLTEQDLLSKQPSFGALDVAFATNYRLLGCKNVVQQVYTLVSLGDARSDGYITGSQRC